MGTVAETTIAITIYNYSAKENKLTFSFSVCSKQTEVFRFCFPLKEINGRCCFPSNLFSVRGNPETWRHGDMESWRWRYGNMETKT
jgi:hypothetical protein